MTSHGPVVLCGLLVCGMLSVVSQLTLPDFHSSVTHQLPKVVSQFHWEMDSITIFLLLLFFFFFSNQKKIQRFLGVSQILWYSHQFGFVKKLGVSQDLNPGTRICAYMCLLSYKLLISLILVTIYSAVP